MDIIFFFRSWYDQYHLRSSINLVMYKIKPGKSTAEPIKNNFKGTIQRFVASNNVISFMSSVIETQTY